jgi:uncharacterized protein YdgA (DUF945 family)
MKKIFITFILISVVVLVSPKFIGSIVETEYQSALNKLNDNPAITIKSTTFSRNWFSGQVVTEMTILLEHEDVATLNLVIEDSLLYGPLIFTNEGLKLALSYSHSSINFTDLLIEGDIENFIKNKIHLSTLLTFSKNIVTQITIDEVSKNVDGNKIMSSKAVGKFTLENENRLYGDFNWEGLSATTSEESFTIEDVTFSVDQTLIDGSYFQGNAISTGSFDFLISAIKANDVNATETLSLNNLLVNASSSIKDDLMEIKMNYSADKLVAAGQKLEKANLAIVLNGLNITVLREVNVLLKKLSNDGAQIFSASNMGKLSSLMAKLLANNPIIEIEDLSVMTPEGKIDSKMLVSIDEKQYEPANFMSILGAINATAQGEAPINFFVKLGLAPMVEQYIKQGLIRQKEDKVSFDLNYTQGQLNVNGNVIPL